MELLYIGEGGPCYYYFCSQVINILIIHLCTRGKFQEQIFMKKSPCHGISFCFANRRIHGPAKRLLTQFHYIYIRHMLFSLPFFLFPHSTLFIFYFIKIPLTKKRFRFFLKISKTTKTRFCYIIIFVQNGNQLVQCIHTQHKLVLVFFFF